MSKMPTVYYFGKVKLSSKAGRLQVARGWFENEAKLVKQHVD